MSTINLAFSLAAGAAGQGESGDGDGGNVHKTRGPPSCDYGDVSAVGMGTAMGGAEASAIRCDVCADELRLLQDVKTLPCLHNFCLRCVPSRGAACPLCSNLLFARPAVSMNGSESSRAIAVTPSPLLRVPPPTSSSATSLLSSEPLALDTSFLTGNLYDLPHIPRQIAHPQSQQLTSVGLVAPMTSSAHQQNLPQANHLSYQRSGSAGAMGAHLVSGPYGVLMGGSAVMPNSAQLNHVQTRAPVPHRDSRCQFCSEGNEVTSRCEDCRDLLCANCVSAHFRVRMTRDHRVVPLAPSAAATGGTSSSSGAHSPLSPPPSSTTTNGVTCAWHHHNLYLACSTCRRNICMRCLPDHDGHKVEPSVDFADDKGFLAQLAQTVSQSQKALEECLEASSRMEERVESRVQAVANEVRAVLHHHISALEERKRDLLQAVETVQQAKVKTLQEQKEEVQACCQRLSNLKSQLQRSTQLHDQSSGASRRELIGQLVQLQAHTAHISLTPYETDNIFFEAPEPALMAAVKALGIIRTGAHAAKSALVGEAFRRTVRDRPAYFTLQAKDALGDPCMTGGDQVSVRVLSKQGETHGEALCWSEVQDRRNGTYLICYRPTHDGEHTVDVRIRGRPVAGSPFSVLVRQGRDYTRVGAVPAFSFGKEGTGDGDLCRPWGVTCDREGRLIVADRSNNRIEIYGPDGSFVAKFGSSGARPGQFDRPAGVAINSRSEIIVADKDNHRIQIFTSQGQFLLKFGEKGRLPGQFNYPWDVAVNAQDQIAVSDTRNHRIQLFSSTGELVRKFGYDNSLLYKQFDSPRGLCFLPDGNLIATDFNNHKLVVVNTDSGEMKSYGREGDWEGAFKRPQGIDVDLEGYIFVADSRNNRVQVLSPDLRPLAFIGYAGRDRTPIMDRPVDVCVTPDGRIFVVDFGNNKILVF